MVLLFYCFVVAVALVVSAFRMKKKSPDLLIFIGQVGVSIKKASEKNTSHKQEEEEEEENGTHVQ